MNVDVYYAGERRAKFLVLPTGTDLSALRFREFDPDLMVLTRFAADVAPDLFGTTPNDVSDQIEAQGYAICASVAGPDDPRN